MVSVLIAGGLATAPQAFAATGPDAPTAVTATAGNASAAVSWTAPVSNGGAAITGYTITPSPLCPTCGGLTSASTTSTVTGLTNGTPYTFTVTATNPAGTSPSSAASSSVTPASGPPTAPNAPTNVTATAGNTTAAVSWTAPANNGGAAITGYTVIPSPVCAACGGLSTTGLNSTVTGLTNGTPYTFTVTATNPAGPSAASTPSTAVTPNATPAPNAPTAVTATAGNASAAVSWTAPASNGGAAITGYTITPSPVCAACGGLSTTGLNSTVTGLTNGTPYTFTVTATNPAGPSAASTPSTAVTPSTAGFTGTAPLRVLDTRSGVGASPAKVGAAQSVTLTVPNLPAGTTAVALNVTVTNPTDVSFLTVYPAGATRPFASNLNFGPGQTVPNMVVVAVGPNNTVTFYNNQGTVDVIADVLGYYATGSGGGFTGMAPARALDTRFGAGGPQAKVGAGQSVTLTVPNLPTGTTAVTLNVTVTNPTDVSFLTVYPGNGSRPVASNLNYGPNQTVPNTVQVPVGPNNTVTFYNNQGTVDVIADVLGSYAPGSGAAFTGTTPARVLDTRFGVGASPAKVGAGQSVTLTVPNLPPGTTAVAMNVTVTNPTDVSFLTAYPGNGSRPFASNLNYGPNQTVPNMVLVPVGPNNTVTFYNNQGTVDVIADLLGSFA